MVSNERVQLVRRHGAAALAGVESVTQGRRGLGGPPVTEHPLVPRLARQPIGFLARMGGAFRGRAD
jgi:hypothetical protein